MARLGGDLREVLRMGCAKWNLTYWTVRLCVIVASRRFATRLTIYPFDKVDVTLRVTKAAKRGPWHSSLGE